MRDRIRMNQREKTIRKENKKQGIASLPGVSKLETAVIMVTGIYQQYFQ